MHIERSDNMLHPKLGENGLELFCYISDAIDETLDEAMAAWGNGNEEVAISTRFTLSDAINSAIDMHEMPAYDKAIDADAKPMFDAMRAELVAMIERIDALIFATPNANVTGPCAGKGRQMKQGQPLAQGPVDVNVRALIDALGNLARRGHYYCEDSWYSCPKAEDGCANENAGTECNCGADEHNAKVEEINAKLYTALCPNA